MQSLALLDAILSPDWEYRYFSFDSRWGPSERMGSMRNGQGDHWFALFSSAGCWLKGFDRLLWWLDGRPETYREWAGEYYEREVPLAAVRSIYAHQPLNQRLVSELNEELRLSDLMSDVEEIGYLD
jgi:hypothetical protein